MSTALPNTRQPAEAKKTLMARLKEETRDVHEKLERDLDLIGPHLTLERYRHVIERFFGYYQPWEEALRPVLAGQLPEFADGRWKLSRLQEDLAHLGVQAGKLPVCTSLPDCFRWPEVLGGMYVTEGATLGGQIISHHLHQNLGLTPGNGSAFFGSYGAQVGQMWRSFCATVEAHAKPEDEDRIVHAARQTFLRMHDWLCGERVDTATTGQCSSDSCAV